MTTPPSAVAPAVARPRRSLIKRLLVMLALTPLLAYVVWCVLLYNMQDELMFVPRFAPPSLPAPPYANCEVISLEVDGGGRGEACYLPHPGASAQHPAPLVVLFHGNAEHNDQHAWFASRYQAMGFSVLMPEYRGYGRAGGTPSQRDIAADMERYYDLIVQRPEVDRARVVYHGRSLGGGVAVELARTRKPALLIVQSTFYSAARMARQYYAPSILVRHPFRSDQTLRGTDIPLLIFHGRYDDIIPVEHGRLLHELVPKSRYFEYATDHNGFPGADTANYWREIHVFLSEHGIIQSKNQDKRFTTEDTEGTEKRGREGF